MFKFDEFIPLKRLTGASVWWVAFSMSGAKIEFENRDKILIVDLDCFSEQNKLAMDGMREVLIGLVGSTLVNVHFHDNERLSLLFSNGQSFDFWDGEPEQMEAFVFSIGDEDYVV